MSELEYASLYLHPIGRGAALQDPGEKPSQPVIGGRLGTTTPGPSLHASLMAQPHVFSIAYVAGFQGLNSFSLSMLTFIRRIDTPKPIPSVSAKGSAGSLEWWGRPSSGQNTAGHVLTLERDFTPVA